LRRAAEAVRVLAVDPGEKHLGLAVSDAGGRIARPLKTVRHISRTTDAAEIAVAAQTEGAEMIVVGCALDSDGRNGPQARHAESLAAAIRAATSLPVVLHDESFTSESAEAAMRASGRGRQARRDHIHAAAAAAILQSYLDADQRKAPPG
jgi:putative Holliday junction resolvase